MTWRRGVARWRMAEPEYTARSRRSCANGALAVRSGQDHSGDRFGASAPMALLAAPLSASAEEPWLGALAESGLRFELLTAPDGSRAGLDRGLEDLIAAADLAGTRWLARFEGTPDDLAYALDVLGMPETPRDGQAVAVLGRGHARAAAAAVDASAAGTRHRLLLLQVDELRIADATEALARGETTAGRRCRTWPARPWWARCSASLST